MTHVSILRLNLLRAMYLLIVVGLACTVWPGLIFPPRELDIMGSVVTCMLAAFSTLALLGLAHPLAMVPILLWELIWKCMWLGTVALPLWQSGQMNTALMAITQACLYVVLVPLVLPWRHMFNTYVTKSADPWRRVST